MKTYMGSGVTNLRVLNMMDMNGQVHAPTALPSEEKYPNNHCIVSLMGPIVNLDAKRKLSHNFPCRELNSNRPARSLFPILTEILRYRSYCYYYYYYYYYY